VRRKRTRGSPGSARACRRNLKPETRKKQSTLKPQLSTPNPQPSTLNPPPPTLNPQPSQPCKGLQASLATREASVPRRERENESERKKEREIARASAKMSPVPLSPSQSIFLFNISTDNLPSKGVQSSLAALEASPYEHPFKSKLSNQ